MSLKVLTYNIRHGKGMDGKVEIGRISTAIAQSGADIIFLQEVDRSLPRSGFIHQAERLAVDLGFHFAFHANFGVLVAGMGNAILCRYPLYSTWNTRLPFAGEPRGLLGAATVVDGRSIQLFCTHWGLTPAQRQSQSLTTIAKLKAVDQPIILCGDFNAVRSSVEIDTLIERTHLIDAGPEGANSFPSDYPVVKIDHILVSQHFTITGAAILDTEASDHRPVMAELSLDFDVS